MHTSAKGAMELVAVREFTTAPASSYQIIIQNLNA